MSGGAVPAALTGLQSQSAGLREGLSELGSLHTVVRRQLELASKSATKLQDRGWLFGESAKDVYGRCPFVLHDEEVVGHCYSAPPLSLEEFERITVPLSQAPDLLPRIMEEHGFAVVTGVIPSQQELQQLEEEFKQDLLELIDAEKLQEAPATVRAAYERLLEEGPWGFPTRSTNGYLTQAAGFVLERCLSHGRFAWAIRRHANVHKAFRPLFQGEGEDLVTSLDVTFFSPGADLPRQHNRPSAHVDQNRSDARPNLGERNTYQGALYVWPALPNGECSTTVVWPGSHRAVWPQMMDDASFQMSGCQGLHYCEVDGMNNAALSQQLAEGWQKNARRVVAPPGSLLLWNSRTVHTGWRGGPRLAQAVCLEPATRRSEAERLSKLRLAALGLPACHWASVGMQHDMSLSAPGVCAQERTLPARGSPDDDLDKVVLPLRSAIRPQALAKDVDMEELSQFVNVEFKYCGMWEAHEGCRPFLEASVRNEFVGFL